MYILGIGTSVLKRYFFITRIGHLSLSSRLYHHISCGLVLWIVHVNSVEMFHHWNPGDQTP